MFVQIELSEKFRLLTELDSSRLFKKLNKAAIMFRRGVDFREAIDF